MLLLPVPFCRLQPISCPEELQVLLSTVWTCSTSPGGPWKWEHFGSSGCFPRNTSGISSSLRSPRLHTSCPILIAVFWSISTTLDFSFPLVAPRCVLRLSALFLFRASLQQPFCHCFLKHFPPSWSKVKGTDVKKNKDYSHQENHPRSSFQVPRCMHLDFVVCTAWTRCNSSGKVLPVPCCLMKVPGTSGGFTVWQQIPLEGHSEKPREGSGAAISCVLGP